MKGASIYVSWVIVIAIVITGIALVLGSGLPLIESAKSSAALSEAEHALQRLDSAIREVSQEGTGSSRLLRIPPGDYRLVDNGIEFRTVGSSLEPLSRRTAGNFALIGGSDVSCVEEALGATPAFRLENSFLKAYIQKINGTIDTKNNILQISSKSANITIVPTDSSIILDGNPATSFGTGTSELTRSGPGLPMCRVKVFVNSTSGISYDIFYTLYAGADFLQVEVRNIK